MKKILIIGLFPLAIFADHNVTYTEEVYNTHQECVEVNNVSPAGTAVGGVVGGVAGATVGHALFGRGWGSALGGLVGTGVGASVAGSNREKQCTTVSTLVGYYNYYIEDGKQKVLFSKEKLQTIKD